MANNIELIPASELPVAEGTEVDVLCVENGELKRKEGASLGGGVKTVNGIEPDENGDVEVSSGVRTVNGIEPDDNGNVEVGGGSSNGPKMLHVKFFSSNSGTYTCSHTFGDIEKIINDGDMVYATLHTEDGSINTMYGYFYFKTYTMPDDEWCHFTNLMSDGEPCCGTLSISMGGDVKYASRS